MDKVFAGSAVSPEEQAIAIAAQWQRVRVPGFPGSAPWEGFKRHILGTRQMPFAVEEDPSVTDVTDAEAVLTALLKDDIYIFGDEPMRPLSVYLTIDSERVVSIDYGRPVLVAMAFERLRQDLLVIDPTKIPERHVPRWHSTGSICYRDLLCKPYLVAYFYVRES